MKCSICEKCSWAGGLRARSGVAPLRPGTVQLGGDVEGGRDVLPVYIYSQSCLAFGLLSWALWIASYLVKIILNVRFGKLDSANIYCIIFSISDSFND